MRRPRFPPQSHKVEPLAVVLDHLMQACNISNDQAGDQVDVRQSIARACVA